MIDPRHRATGERRRVVDHRRSRVRDPVRRALAALAFSSIVSVALVVVACAPLPPPGMLAAQTTARRADSTTARAPAPPVVAAVLDSAPSPEAIDVLNTIPEPLRPDERVDAPADSVPAPGAEAETPGDSLAEADSSGSAPVPEPTYPLGLEPPPPDTTARDTSAAVPPADAPSATSTAPSAPPTTPAHSAPAIPDTCWRLQVGAPANHAKATSLQRAAESQLLIPMVVESESRLFKVRSRDCWDRAAADLLKQRAVASGFSGAFRFVKKAR